MKSNRSEIVCIILFLLLVTGGSIFAVNWVRANNKARVEADPFVLAIEVFDKIKNEELEWPHHIANPRILSFNKTAYKRREQVFSVFNNVNTSTRIYNIYTGDTLRLLEKNLQELNDKSGLFSSAKKRVLSYCLSRSCVLIFDDCCEIQAGKQRLLSMKVYHIELYGRDFKVKTNARYYPISYFYHATIR